MTSFTIVLLIIIHIFCCIIDYGIMFAYCQREYPFIAKDDYEQDIYYCILMSLGGILSLIASGFFFMGHNFHGFKFK